jgi:hypothetical protein
LLTNWIFCFRIRFLRCGDAWIKKTQIAMIKSRSHADIQKVSIWTFENNLICCVEDALTFAYACLRLLTLACSCLVLLLAKWFCFLLLSLRSKNERHFFNYCTGTGTHSTYVWIDLL